MCELCKIQDETGISDEVIMRIVKVVEAAEKAHHDHTMLSILYTLDTPNLKITAESAQRAQNDMEYEGVKVGERVSDTYDSLTYSVVKEDARDDTLKPLKPGEVSPENDFAALFKALGLEF